MKYQDFLKGKERAIEFKGVEVEELDINPMLYDFQKAIVQWACSKGRAAIFADCGLGKTFIQLEWARLIYEKIKKEGDVLILAPLTVSHQTKKEAEKIGVKVNICKEQSDVKPGINITNYERLQKYDCSVFQAIVLDESSILKSYMGKTKIEIINTFRGTPYKLCCTATPSPNDHMEILNHSAFLGYMESHEALAIWFINSANEMGSYRLKKHAVKDFWKWVSSWGVSLSKPSDIGNFDDTKFNLPPLNIIEKIIRVDPVAQREDGMLIRIPAMNATAFHKEKRLTADDRAKLSAEIVASIDSPVMVWCDTNYEADALKKYMPGVLEVRGNHSTEKKEEAAMGFINQDIRVLISKPSIFGFGLNFQHCSNVIFCGMNYSYESFYQATRRFWRFGQGKEVNVYIILGDTELNILNIIKEKEKKFKDLKVGMYQAMAEFQDMSKRREYKMKNETDKTVRDKWTMILGDAVEEIKSIPNESVHFTLFSPPFSNLYIYSDSYRDMGNTKNDMEFLKHYEFMIPDMYRITIQGRLCAIHCKDLVNYKGRDGRAGLRDLPGDIIRVMEKHNWQYHSRITIFKDPVTEMYRTKAHGLLYKQLRRDSSYSRNGLADYILLFRKWSEGEDPEPIKHDRSTFPLEQWQKWASPVWMDIQPTNVLNCRISRDDKDEKHICPLQLDLIDRAIILWSNPGDLIFSPFAGIGSEGYGSLRLNRRFLGIELKRAYYERAVKNLQEVDYLSEQPLLFAKEEL
uniref:Putative methyltransferase n=1 Tax=viral metagenome TaxID=1070528 RepID=A0A6M3L5C1_9ZZZZ